MPDSRGGFRRTATVAALLAVTAITAVFGQGHEKERPTLRLGLAKMLPSEFQGWAYTPARTTLREGDPEFLNELFEGIYTKPGLGSVVLTVEFSSDSRRRYELHLPDVCHRYRGDAVLMKDPTRLALPDGREMDLALMQWEYPLRGVTALCAYWFVIGGRQSADVGAMKIRQLLAGLAFRGSTSLLLRVDVLSRNTPAGDLAHDLALITLFTRELYDVLDSGARSALFGEEERRP